MTRQDIVALVLHEVRAAGRDGTRVGDIAVRLHTGCARVRAALSGLATEGLVIRRSVGGRTVWFATPPVPNFIDRMRRAKDVYRSALAAR